MFVYIYINVCIYVYIYKCKFEKKSVYFFWRQWLRSM